MEQKRIYDILKGLVACDSISCTDKELKAEKYVYDFLQSIPYFKEHPERCGLHKIPNDPFSRAVPYSGPPVPLALPGPFGRPAPPAERISWGRCRCPRAT